MKSFCIVLFITIFFTGLAQAEQSAERKPNIIFILADDLGYGELGCYGQTKIKTPRIDKMASEGMKFTQFYSGQTVCGPSRCSLLTGMHQGHAQVRENSPHLMTQIKAMVKDDFEGQWPLRADTFTVGHLLQEQGYKTACVGKWGLGHPQNSGAPNKQGFDFYYGYVCQRQAHNFYPRYLYKNDKKEYLEGNDRGLTGKSYSADMMDVECLNFIRENKDQPFFLYYANPIPHLALQVPDENLQEYKEMWPGEKPYSGKRGYLPHKNPRAAYAAMVSHMDTSVGKILDLLKELKIDDNTMVVFTSDNGPTYLGGYDREFFNGSGKLRGYKGNLYEGGIRVPMVVRWPGKIKAGTVNDHVGAFWDFMATAADMSGAATPVTDGISFLPTLLGEEQESHKSLYWEFFGYGGWQVVRQGDWKAVRKNLHKGNKKIELYNLKSDLAEVHDVASEFPEIIAKMRKIMKK
ncbi:MAG: arylsulfatase, partial [Lentisphaeraceae bacterium]|nr:arylsulfatase [Lentisphaeraceae bacterium]